MADDVSASRHEVNPSLCRESIHTRRSIAETDLSSKAYDSQDTVTNEEEHQVLRISQLPSLYLQLSKAKLTAMVALSALAGYSMAPGEIHYTTCFLTALGTFMSSCSANAFNQYIEVPYDSQMARTKQRVLVKGLISSTHAITFASAIGLGGILILAVYANITAAIISALTWALYVTTYTPLKRICIGNTWIGALVGALPPLIGWVARAGELGPGAYIMAGFLFTWQFPHFNALSWNLRSDYSRAGYCMMATKNPGLCQSVALRHCLFINILCILAPYFNLTNWPFALFSMPLNLTFSYLGWCFYKHADGQTASHLFKFSLLHLPLLMLMLIISKKNIIPLSTKLYEI